MSNLFSDDEGDHDGKETMLTINEHYAKAFEYRKEREELEKLKAKYGSDYDPDGSGSDISTDSESAESEDEHGEELTPAVDAAILRTLARIRKKDPEIYNSQKNIFGEEQERLAEKAPKVLGGQTKSKTKSKPLTVRQNNLDAMLNLSRSPSPEMDSNESNEPMTHVQEQEALRRETIAAFHGAVAGDGDDDFLIPREKTKDEREAEEEEYRAFLEREVGDLKDLVVFEEENQDRKDGEVKADGSEPEGEGEGEDTDKKKKKKKKKKSKKASGEAESGPAKTKAEKDQEFLMNYILNRGWIDRSEGHVPTYHEVTNETTERRKKKGKSKAEPQDATEDAPAQNDDDDDEDGGLLSDSSFESVASFFETSYNHRFEEPGAATIPTYPRNLTSVVRRQDTTRKEARERRKERQEQELQKKKEEVRRLKALKMREVKRKLELIGRQGGLKNGGVGKGVNGGEEEDGDDFVDEALRELDLEGEWDPEKHDRQMAGLFDRGQDAFEDEEYQDDDDDGVHYAADGRPIWDDDVDIGDIPISDDDIRVHPQPSKKEKKKKKKKKKDDDDQDEYEGGVDVDAMDADVHPAFGEEEEWDGTEEMRKRKINEYMDEVYGLDFNDMVGGMPTRFRYVPVEKQSYALTPAEILMATDQELNEYMSVKKYAPYRQDKGDRSRWKKSTQEKLHELKAKVSERAGTSFRAGPGAGAWRSNQEDGVEKVKKRKGKKERLKLKAAAEENGEADVDAQVVPSKPQVTKESSKRKRDPVEDESQPEKVENGIPSAEGGEDEGAAKKKRKRRHKKKGTDGVAVEA